MKNYEVTIEAEGFCHRGWDYPTGYFPRGFHYKRDAVACKERAERLGAKNPQVKDLRK
jgi:hypothetical protein